MPNIIVIGDQTTHGGCVTAGSSHCTIDGKQIARLGDPCSCPMDGHANCSIAEGDPNDTIGGIPVAYEGHKTTCGATLIASVSNCAKS